MQRVTETICIRKETVGIDIRVTLTQFTKNMQSVTTVARPPLNIRKRSLKYKEQEPI